jgi:hypothetical protein
MTELSDRPTLADEKLLTLSQAAKYFPSRPCTRTVWRWVNRGIGGTKLETVRIGAKRFTSEESCDRWISQLNSKEDSKCNGCGPANNTGSATS